MLTKLRSGKYMVPVTITDLGETLKLEFKYHPELKDDIKAMEGARWDPEAKCWKVKKSARNLFNLDYLAYTKANPELVNPFEPYERELLPFNKVSRQTSTGETKDIFKHQIQLIRHGITRRQCIFAAEPGCGKTLAAIEVIEWACEQDKIPDGLVWYVGPSAALEQVKLDFEYWKCKVEPVFMTYEALTKLVANWQPGQITPKVLILDESSRIKNPTAKRSLAAKHVADAMRAEYSNPFIIEMSGSPAPRMPADWWHQCEVARPGFIKEGTYIKFQRRLALIEMRENEGGQQYPKLVTYLDDERKCAICGQFEGDDAHNLELVMAGGNGHSYKKSVNEVQYLYKRMQGLVLVQLKKDCIDLPEKVFKVIKCKPNISLLNAAKLVTKKAKSTIQALTLLRELSDGFQYTEKSFGTKDCAVCKGLGSSIEFFNPAAPDEPITQEWLVAGGQAESRFAPCEPCEGTGQVDEITRIAQDVTSPKEEVLREILEDHEDVGRLVTYAGFKGSVDKCARISLQQGWNVCVVDGRGWHGRAPNGVFNLSRKDLYRAFRFDLEKYPKINFIAQASSAGMGLNLTASPTQVFYSNDFNHESRAQALERCHRPGIEKTLARTGRTTVQIIDIVNLPSDQFVLDNHAKKQRLQELSMGVLSKCMDGTSHQGDR